jgi:hypothetical protein
VKLTSTVRTAESSKRLGSDSVVLTPKFWTGKSQFRSVARAHAALLFTVTTILLFSLALWLVPVNSLNLTNQWVNETVRQYGFVASDDQRWAYFVGIISVLFFSLSGFILVRRGAIDFGDRTFLPKLGPAACITLTALGLGAYRLFVGGWIVSWATAILLLTFLFTVAAPRIRLNVLERGSLVLIGAYLAGVTVPGLFVAPIPLMAADPISLVQFENHLLYLTLPGPALAAGQNFFDQLPFTYGLLMPSLMSVLEHRMHALSIGDQLRIVQIAQVLFSLTATAAYFAYRPRATTGIFVALLIAAPYWASAGLGIWHANQTGYRSLGLSIGMLGLMSAGRLEPHRAAWCLGAICGVALLLNLETAVAVAAGFGIFAVVRTGTIPFGLYARMAAGGMAIFALYLVAYGMALGRLPFSSKAVDFLALIGHFASGGYGSRLFVPGHEDSGYFLVPFAVVMFVHATYVVIDGIRRLGWKPLPLRSSQRIGAATTLLVWFSYYFNSPNWWQIWTHLFLYGFLIIDQFDYRLFAVGRSSLSHRPLAERFRHMRIRSHLFVFLLLLAFVIPHTNRHLVKYTREFMYPDWLRNGHEISVLSGILMPVDLAMPLQQKAKRLADLTARANGQLTYLTFDMAFMPRLTDLFQPQPYRDPFTEIRGEASFDHVIDNLLSHHPATILIDAPTGPLAMSGPRKDFQDRLREAIGRSYSKSGIEDGWEIWHPTAVQFPRGTR